MMARWMKRPPVTARVGGAVTNCNKKRSPGGPGGWTPFSATNDRRACR